MYRATIAFVEYLAPSITWKRCTISKGWQVHDVEEVVLLV